MELRDLIHGDVERSAALVPLGYHVTFGIRRDGVQISILIDEQRYEDERPGSEVPTIACGAPTRSGRPQDVERARRGLGADRGFAWQR